MCVQGGGLHDVISSTINSQVLMAPQNLQDPHPMATTKGNNTHLHSIVYDAPLMWRQHPTHGNNVAATSDQWQLWQLTSNQWLQHPTCLLYTSPSPRDGLLSRMPSSA